MVMPTEFRFKCPVYPIGESSEILRCYHRSFIASAVARQAGFEY
jgi:hypothetical protein